MSCSIVRLGRSSPMHIPDGFVDGKTAVAAGVLSTIGLGVAVRRVRREISPRRMPLLGLAAAFLFAAQLVNFPVAGGTSGHLLGSVLVAALLGPSAAVVVVATVLIVQCLLFADGGLSALGSNLFDMGILSTAGGYLVYRTLVRHLRGLRGQIAAIAFAGWFSVVLASVGCAGQLAWSGTVALTTGLPVMAALHMLIGLGEGLISALVFLAIHRVRPELTAALPSAGPGKAAASTWEYGLCAALGIALFVAPMASPWPDGLARVASRLGFADKAAAPLVPAVAAHYHLPGVHSATVATALAGGLGTIIVFVLALVLGRILVPTPPATRDSSC
jgi:cobalt/nickel transport system permease protein